MERYNITHRGPRQAQPGAEPRPFSWALSAAAHVVLLLAVLSIVRAPIPAPPQETSVDMVFQPPAAAATALPGPPAAQPAPPVSIPPPEPAQDEPPPPPAPAPPSVAPSPPPAPTAEAPPAPPPAVFFAPVPSPARPQPRHASNPPRPSPQPAAAPPTHASGVPAPSAITAPPAGSPPPEPRASTIDGTWMQALGSWLAAHKTYPEEARSLGEEGRLAVRFTVDRAGRVIAVDIVRSSGSPRLDDAARHMLQGATLPSLPATMTQNSITVTVQIRYALAP